MVANRPDEVESEADSPDALPRRLSDRITPESFREWHREREFRDNIRKGEPWWNTPAPVKPPKRHSPHQLGKCHRKVYYQQHNAPDETPAPNGIFWTGTKFEEDLMMPYLESVAREFGLYVRNSMRVDYTVTTRHGDLRFKGKTDPVIVDEDSDPVLLTEVKTKRELDGVDSPNDHHLAQTLTYLRGLSEEYRTTPTDALIIYGDRTTLDIEPFHVRLDGEDWREVVLEWAIDHTGYRLDEQLPPADPEFDWECGYCSFKNRCGKGESHVEDAGPRKLLPRFDDYPRQNVVEYLDAHPEDKLTPALAQKYPDLAEEYEVSEMMCEVCLGTFDWQDGLWDVVSSEVVFRQIALCPKCYREENVPAHLYPRMAPALLDENAPDQIAPDDD